MFIKTWFGNYAMARIIPFAFKNHNSILFDIDARLKFFVLCLLNVSILSAPIILCFVFSGILIFCFWQSNINFLNILKKIKYFIILLLIVFASRAISFDDNNFSFQITEHGIKNGFLVSFKFFLIMLTSILFSLTTTPLMLKNAIQWFLKPIFFIPEKRVALMISLSLKFMPIILRHTKEISNAQQARCGNLQKNPVKRITLLIFILFKKIFLSADNLSLSMQARCYNEDRTEPEFRKNKTN